MRRKPTARLEDIIDHIRDEPKTAKQIAAELSLPYTSVKRYVFALHLRRLVHIDGWSDAGSRFSPSFIAGEGDDCPKPSCKAQRLQRARKYTPMMLADVDDEPVTSPCKPAGTVAVNVQRDPLVAALFGPAIRAGAAKTDRDPLMSALFGDAA